MNLYCRALFFVGLLSAGIQTTLAQSTSINLPMIGVNGQLSTYDPKAVNYGSPLLVDAINELGFSVIRFPGGTNANSYNWVAYRWGEDGSRTFSVLPDDSAFAKEGSHLGINALNDEIFCSPDSSWQAHKAFISSELINTNDLLSEFKSNVIDGQTAKPLYVLRVFDPYYFMGKSSAGALMKSPFFSLSAPGWAPASVIALCAEDPRCLIKRAALADLRRTLLKIMFEHQDGTLNADLFNAALNDGKLYRKANLFNVQDILPIATEDLIVYDNIYFELGNELYSSVYSKFLPEEGIITAPCSDADALTDAILYAEIVADILPLIKQYFPNARVAVVAGNRRGCSLWTSRVTSTLKNIPSLTNESISSYDEIDAFTLHFYASTDSLMNVINPSVSSLFAYRDQLLHLLANEFEENYEDKSLWVTEIGFPAPEYEEQRPFIGTWNETLMILSFIHELGLRERFVQDYLDQCICSNRRESLRNSPILPDFKDIEMVLVHTIGVNYGVPNTKFQGVLRGIDIDADLKVDEYKLSSLGLAANLYRQFLRPESTGTQLKFKKSLPLIPNFVFVDSLEVTRRCAFQPKPKDMVYFTGVMGMRAYNATQAPGRMQDMFINVTNEAVDVSDWSLPFMSNGSADQIWTYTAAGLSQDLLLDMGNLRGDLYSMGQNEILPAGLNIGIQVQHSIVGPLIIPPRSVMMVGRIALLGLEVDDHGMSEEEYLKSNDSLEMTQTFLRKGEETLIRTPLSGLISIYDATGRLLRAEISQGSYSLHTDDLPSGTYIARFSAEGQRPIAQKFSVYH